MNLPEPKDNFGKKSMEKLGIEPGEDWTVARAKMVAAFEEDGFVIIEHILQAFVGKRVDASDPISKRCGAELILPVVAGDEALISLALDNVAAELLR